MDDSCQHLAEYQLTHSPTLTKEWHLNLSGSKFWAISFSPAKFTFVYFDCKQTSIYIDRSLFAYCKWNFWKTMAIKFDLATSSFLKRFFFQMSTRKHENSVFKFFSLENVFQMLRFRWYFLPDTCGWKPTNPKRKSCVFNNSQEHWRDG